MDCEWKMVLRFRVDAALYEAGAVAPDQPPVALFVTDLAGFVPTASGADLFVGQSKALLARHDAGIWTIEDEAPTDGWVRDFKTPGTRWAECFVENRSAADHAIVPIPDLPEDVASLWTST